MGKYINTEGKKNFLRFVKNEVQESFGEAGMQTYIESIKKLNIRENDNSSKHDIEKLVSEIEKSLTQTHDNSNAFCDRLRQKLTIYEKFSPIFWNFLSNKKENEDIQVSCINVSGLALEGLEGKILELLYQNYDSEYILKDLDIKEEELADIIISLDNKGLVTNKNKKWILTEKGKDILNLEGKILELLYQNYDSEYILKDLDIKEEELADIIISLDNKGLVTNKNKKWILTEKGKDIFEKRENLFKKLKIEYLRGEINNRDEFNIRKKELEDIPQIILIRRQ